eukprot:gene19739-23479_t
MRSRAMCQVLCNCCSCTMTMTSADSEDRIAPLSLKPIPIKRHIGFHPVKGQLIGIAVAWRNNQYDRNHAPEKLLPGEIIIQCITNAQTGNTFQD